MDEETMRAVNESVKRLFDAFLAWLEPVKELADKAVASLAETVNAILEAIKRRQKERSKWRRMPLQIIHPLLLDKRSRIHRCRNAI